MNYFYVLVIILLINIVSVNATNIELDAQEIFVKNKDIIIAQDDVVAKYLEHNLKAKYLEYNKLTEQIIAKDQVSYSDDQDKLKIFSNKIISNNDFSVINATQVYGKLGAENNITAKNLYKANNKLILDNASYTSCNICRNNKKIIPQWQLDAKKITYLKEKQNIYFSHMFFKIYNIPILYLPKFIYPAPEVKKRTGLLPPKYASDSLLGTQIFLPIFIDLAPNYDLTYTPTIFSKNNIIHDMKFRYMNDIGNLDLSLAYVRENQQIRDDWQAQGVNVSTEDPDKYYIDMNYLFNYEYLAFEGNILNISEQAFLQRYKNDFSQYSYSDINLNHVSDKQQLIISSSKLDDFNNNTKTKELPYISFASRKKIFKHIFYDYNINYVNLDADQNNTKRNRIYYKDKIYKEFIYKGFLTKLAFSNLLRGYYSAENTGDNYIGYVPQLSLDLQRPYIKLSTKTKYLITPQITMLLSPDNNNSSKIVNLDSATTYLDYSNLFLDNKVSGVDFIEEGYRVNYGIASSLYRDNLFIENFIGQSFYNKKQDDIARISGLKEDFSDLVGNFKLSYQEYINLSYNYKLLEDNLSLYHNQVNLATQINDNINFNLGYTKYKYNMLDNNSKPLEQLSTNITYLAPDKFKVTATNLRNMLSKEEDSNAGTITSVIDFELYGDCVTYTINLSKNHISTDSVKPDTRIMFGFKIKGLD